MVFPLLEGFEQLVQFLRAEGIELGVQSFSRPLHQPPLYRLSPDARTRGRVEEIELLCLERDSDVGIEGGLEILGGFD